MNIVLIIKEKIFKRIAILLILCFITDSCTEPYVLLTNTYEEAIVIEATITNEFKNHEIKISKSQPIESEEPIFESGAKVYVVDDLNNQYNFDEKDGIYVSQSPFEAMPEREYRLSVTTKDGKEYTSRKEKLPATTTIDSVTTKLTTKDNETGVQIYVNSYDPTGNSKLYRYEYYETYKVVAPKYISFMLEVVGEQSLGIVRRTTNVRTCYSSSKSNDIFLTNTSNLSEDRVENFPIRFISVNDPVIAQRYSILVRQYVQNLAAYTYYETVQKTINVGSVLSQNQPGFIYGNIRSMDNSNEKVIGFFDVSSVSEKRIFFNYEDIFPNKLPRPFFYDCTEYNWNFCFGDAPFCHAQLLINEAKAYRITFVKHNPRSFDTPFDDVYTIVDSKCGDCSTFSSLLKPLFWID